LSTALKLFRKYNKNRWLHNNMLTGQIPAQLSTLRTPGLSLRLNDNYLTGIVPAQVYGVFNTVNLWWRR
jgi:hypothetical protein